MCLRKAVVTNWVWKRKVGRSEKTRVDIIVDVIADSYGIEQRVLEAAEVFSGGRSKTLEGRARQNKTPSRLSS